jgi:hypothetical protein
MYGSIAGVDLKKKMIHQNHTLNCLNCMAVFTNRQDNGAGNKQAWALLLGEYGIFITCILRQI